MNKDISEMQLGLLTMYAQRVSDWLHVHGNPHDSVIITQSDLEITSGEYPQPLVNQKVKDWKPIPTYGLESDGE